MPGGAFPERCNNAEAITEPQKRHPEKEID